MIKNNLKIQEYIDDKRYLIYKKSLSYKGGVNRLYYLIIRNSEIIDMLAEKELAGLIDQERLSNRNIDLMVYKAVKCENGRYYSFRTKDCIEYRLGELMETNNSIGMFFCKNKELTENHFNNEEDRVILKMKVKIDDLIGGNTRDFQFARCIPLEVVN